MRALAFAPVHALHQTAQLFIRSEAPTLWLVPLHLGVLALSLKKPRLSMGALAALGVLQCALAFPRTATHLWLGVVVSLLFALLGEDLPALGRAALALPLIVLCWSGVQKLVHGYWFHAELLAWMLVSRPDVTLTALPVLDEGTRAQLAGLRRDVLGSGPFRLGGGWTLLSNSVWAIELAAPLAAWPKVLRPRLWGLLLGLLWALQLVAHEWQFALLFTNLLLCAAPARVQLRGRAAVAFALLLLITARALDFEVGPDLVS